MAAEEVVVELAVPLVRLPTLHSALRPLHGGRLRPPAFVRLVLREEVVVTTQPLTTLPPAALPPAALPLAIMPLTTLPLATLPPATMPLTALPPATLPALARRQ